MGSTSHLKTTSALSFAWIASVLALPAATIPSLSIESATPSDLHGLSARATSPNAGWGLTYLSEKAKNPTDNTYHYLDTSGEGVDVYVIDSGVNPISGFQGRLGDTWACPGSSGTGDTRDHGTRVASLVASDKFGSAKKATIHSYKVDNAAGIPDDNCIISALKEIVSKVKTRKTASGYKGSVINMSIAAKDSDDLETQIALAIQNKVTVVGTAGNDNADASGYYPCVYDDVICVGAIDKDYSRWVNSANSGSGYGKKVTIFAPGNELSAYDKGGTEVNDVQGTSFAAPLVAGIVATFIGVEGTAMTPALALQRLRANQETGLSSLKGSPDALANNGYRKASNGLPYIGAPGAAAQPTAAANPTTAGPSPSAAKTTAPAPSPTQDIESCNVDYHFLWDSFSIQGADFDNSKLKNGDGLHDQLKGCGDVTEWKFSEESAGGRYQWEASGRLPIGTMSCIKKAIKSAGGPQNNECTGNGD